MATSGFGGFCQLKLAFPAGTLASAGSALPTSRDCALFTHTNVNVAGARKSCVFLTFEMASLLLFLNAADARRQMTTNLKANGQTALRLIYCESVNFTLPIQKKTLQPSLSPFSVKRPVGKEAKDDCARQLQR